MQAWRNGLPESPHGLKLLGQGNTTGMADRVDTLFAPLCCAP